MVLPGQCFNQDFFVSNVLPEIIGGRALGRLKLKAHGTFLHLDTAHPHLCNDEFEYLEIRTPLHSPDSPSLAPCNFWPFGRLQHCLKGQLFDGPMDYKQRHQKI
jgi:hypothetical protein